MSKVPKRGIWLAVSLICLMAFGRKTDALETSGDTVTEVFSEKEGFYQEDILVELAIPGMSEIYYTQNGAVPSREATLYQEPIKLAAEAEGVNVYTIRAIVYQQELDRKEGELLDSEQAAALQEYRNRLLEEEQMIRDFAWERPGYMWEELKVLEDF